MNSILGDLWSISDLYYHAMPWRGEEWRWRRERRREEVLFTQCNIPPSSGSLPRPCLAFLRGRWDPREDSQSCRVKLHLRRLQQREEGAGVLAGGSEGLVLTFLLKLFTWGTGALSEHHSSYLHSSVLAYALFSPDFPRTLCSFCWERRVFIFR